MGVTAGAHRLWSHGAYTASAPMEWILVIMFAFADQRDIVSWALTHILHHRYSDTDQDPHNRTRGFWYCHILWIFDQENDKRAAQLISQKDLLLMASRMSPAVRWHDANFWWLGPCCSLGIPTVLATCWNDGLGGLLVAGALRWFFVQNTTFMVNSVAHGPHLGGTIGPRACGFVAFLTLGEGWHKFHHEYPWDYAAAELDALQQFNPTKTFIDICYKLHMCGNRRRKKASARLGREQRDRLAR